MLVIDAAQLEYSVSYFQSLLALLSTTNQEGIPKTFQIRHEDWRGNSAISYWLFDSPSDSFIATFPDGRVYKFPALWLYPSPGPIDPVELRKALTQAPTGSAGTMAAGYSLAVYTEVSRWGLHGEGMRSLIQDIRQHIAIKMSPGKLPETIKVYHPDCEFPVEATYLVRYGYYRANYANFDSVATGFRLSQIDYWRNDPLPDVAPGSYNVPTRMDSDTHRLVFDTSRMYLSQSFEGEMTTALFQQIIEGIREDLSGFRSERPQMLPDSIGFSSGTRRGTVLYRHGYVYTWEVQGAHRTIEIPVYHLLSRSLGSRFGCYGLNLPTSSNTEVPDSSIIIRLKPNVVAFFGSSEEVDDILSRSSSLTGAPSIVNKFKTKRGDKFNGYLEFSMGMESHKRMAIAQQLGVSGESRISEISSNLATVKRLKAL